MARLRNEVLADMDGEVLEIGLSRRLVLPLQQVGDAAPQDLGFGEGQVRGAQPLDEHRRGLSPAQPRSKQ